MTEPVPPLRVLLAGEDPDHRLLLGEALTGAAPAVETGEASSLSEALAALQQGSWDVVLCDQRLGEHTGLDLLRAVLEQGLDVPFVLVADGGGEDLVRRAFLGGAADYVAKEAALLNPSVLAARVRQAVDRSRLTRERHRAEVLLQSFLENNPFAILILDEHGSLVRWNRALERLEAHPEDLDRLRSYRPFEDPQLEEAGIRPLLERARRGERVELPPFPWDPERAGLRGPVRVLAGAAFPLEIEIGGPRFLCIMVQDVTLSETARRERDEYAAVLSSLLNASRAAILFVDVEGRVRFVNRRLEEYFGVDPRAFVGHPYPEIARRLAASTRDPEGFLALLEEPGPEREDEIEVVRPEHRHLRRHSGPVLGTGGRLIGRIELYIDETGAVERRRLLEARNRELDAFASRLAHDLKTPLVSLKGFADLLDRTASGSLDERSRMFLERIRTSAALLNEMVDGLRELSRASEPTVCPVDVDPLPVLRLVAENLRAMAEEHGVRVEIPEAAPPVRCDRAKLFQIFQNLVSNGIRYSDPAKPDRWVRVEVVSGPDPVAFRVVDNGLGMDEEDLTWVFQPFRRGRGKRAGGGMGLGLALTLRVTEACGGRVEVESTPGTGSVFTVSLPGVPTGAGGEPAPPDRPR